MDEDLTRYIKRKANALARSFPDLDAEDLEHEAWVVWAESGRRTDKRPLKKFFNRTWMQAIRDSQKFVSIEEDLNDEASTHPFAMIEYCEDLKTELMEVETPTSEWRLRVAKEAIKSYLKGED